MSDIEDFHNISNVITNAIIEIFRRETNLEISEFVRLNNMDNCFDYISIAKYMNAKLIKRNNGVFAIEINNCLFRISRNIFPLKN